MTRPLRAIAEEFIEQDRPIGGYPSGGRRSIKLTSADGIKVRPVHWLWTQRIALGTLALIAGREGIGKSTFAYQLAADITRGTLPGRFLGRPRSVIIAATEDSWSHTIVPRLMAARADLSKVFRVDVETSEGTAGYLSLPRDLKELERSCGEVDAALILLDPLMSRLGADLDTHKDAEVRVALEPLVEVADRAQAAVVGLLHFNKGSSADALNMVMGSKAFTAVARAVLAFTRDPENESTVLVGQIKNNLGRDDLPTLSMTIEGAHVADTEEGPVYSSRIVWGGESNRRISEVLAEAGSDPDVRTATQEAAEWLEDYLTQQGGSDDSATIKKEGRKVGHSVDALKRGRRRIGVTVESSGFPRKTWWTLPVGATVGESAPTALTAPTAPTEAQSAQSAQLVQSERTPREGAPTEVPLYGEEPL